MSARTHGSVSKKQNVSTLSCAAALVASMCLGTSAFGPEPMSTAAERKTNAPSQISTGPVFVVTHQVTLLQVTLNPQT